MELIIFHLCYKTKWFPEGGVNSHASTLEKLLPARNCFFPGQRNSTIPDLWFQVGFCFCFVFFSCPSPSIKFTLTSSITWQWPGFHVSDVHLMLTVQITCSSFLRWKRNMVFVLWLLPHCAGRPCWISWTALWSKEVKAITSAICWRPAHLSESWG